MQLLDLEKVARWIDTKTYFEYVLSPSLSLFFPFSLFNVVVKIMWMVYALPSQVVAIK